MTTVKPYFAACIFGRKTRMLYLCFMPQELKTHVLSFVDSLAVEKKGALYNSIIHHLEEHRKQPKLAPKRPRIHISDSACISCEG